MGRLEQDEFVVENFFFSIKKKATTASPFASIRVVLPASTPFPMSVSLKSDTCMSDRGSRETKKPRSIGLESIRRGIGRILIWHVHRKHRLGFALCAVPFVFVKLGLFFQQNGCFAPKQLPTRRYFTGVSRQPEGDGDFGKEKDLHESICAMYRTGCTERWEWKTRSNEAMHKCNVKKYRKINLKFDDCMRFRGETTQQD